MIIYADYEFYLNTYHGDMSEADFLKYSKSASDFIDCVTFGRITQELMEDEDAAYKIRTACCECADIYKRYSCCAKDGISQEKVGDYSVSYSQPKSDRTRKNELYGAVKELLHDITCGDVS